MDEDNAGIASDHRLIYADFKLLPSSAWNCNKINSIREIFFSQSFPTNRSNLNRLKEFTFPSTHQFAL